MSFRLTIVDLSGGSRRAAPIPPRTASGPLLAAAALAVAAMLVFDFSPYGPGYLALLLGAAESWLDAAIGSFRSAR